MTTSKTIRILLIEDNPDDAFLIQEYILDARSGRTRFIPVHAESLQGGLSILQQETVDLLLLDLSLPDSHGMATFSQVHRRAPQVPVIVLSGLNDEEIAIQAVREGAQDYLTKSEVF